MTYKENVDIYIKNEIKPFKEYFSMCKPSIGDIEQTEHFNINDLWKWFNKNKLIDVFPNLYIALKIYLTYIFYLFNLYQVQTVRPKELFQN